MRNRLKFLSFLLALSLVIFGAYACKKKEQKGTAQTTSTKVNEPDFSATLLKRIPKDAFGFYYASLSGPAYEKFEKSPWSQSKKVDLKGSGDFQKFAEALKKVGIDINDRRSFQRFFKEMAGFISPVQGEALPVGFGIIFKGDSDVNLPQTISELSKELGAQGFNVKDFNAAGGVGFSFTADILPEIPNPAINAMASSAVASKMISLYVTAKDDLGVISISPSVVQTVFNTTSNSLPDLLSSTRYKDALQSIHDDNSRLVVGYLDFSKFLQEAASSDSDTPNKLEQFPVQSLVYSQSMTDVLEANFKMFYSPKSELQQKWFNAVAGASTSASILSSIPDNPLLFLSVDGQVLAQLGKLSAQQVPAKAQELEEILQIIGNTKRIGLSIRVAAVGQSLLPVPDIMLAVESSAAAETLAKLKELTEQNASFAGAKSGGWKKKNVSGHDVEFIATPFNIGVYLTVVDNLVLATSTESHLREALQNIASNGVFQKTLTPKATESLVDAKSIANMHINFQEVKAMLNNVKATMSAFAPQAANQELFSEDMMENIGRIGRITLMVNADSKSIAVSGFAEPLKELK